MSARPTSSPEHGQRDVFETPWPLAFVIVLHLVLAWPGADERGVIAEEIQPYLQHYPLVLDRADRFYPPNDDDAFRTAIMRGDEVTPRWVGTGQWPEIGYHSPTRLWPVFVRGHQTALGTTWGLVLGPLLGEGVAGVRRSSVLLGALLLGLTWALGRRMGVSGRACFVAVLACALSPSLWFFCRTGYGFELASRTVALAALVLAAPRRPMTTGRALAVGVAVAAAVLCRATIVATLGPALLLTLAHPLRWAGWRRSSLPIVVGGGLTLLSVGLALACLPFDRGNVPGANLPIDELAARTATAPETAWWQLAWLVDGRFLLSPLVACATQVEPGLVRPALGALVLGVALVRWWRGTALEPERLFACTLIGHALFGAWLYGSPLQFQLGMALEPIFALAVAAQLSSLPRPRAAVALAGALLTARAASLAALAADERRTDNPMLSGRAQRELARVLAREGAREEHVLTTTYDHVGVLESMGRDAMRPIHAWHVLKEGSRETLEERWGALLDAHRICDVVLTRASHMVEGDFTDNEGVARALAGALAARDRTVTERHEIRGDGGGVVFEVVRLSGCGTGPEER